MERRRDYEEWADGTGSLLSDPYPPLEESSLEGCVGGSFVRRALVGVPRYFVYYFRYFVPADGCQGEVHPHRSVHLPVIENTNRLANGHDVPTA